MNKTIWKLFFVSFLGAQVDYESQVQTILSANCTGCHGYSGGLNLTSYSGLMSGGNSGSAIIAGNHTASELYSRIVLPESSTLDMPPNGSLSQSDIDIIAQWIDEGALEAPNITTDYITIAQARAQELGSTATVRGIVTSPNYGGESFTSYYIEDTSAGINLYASGSNLDPPANLSLGDYIEVTGEIATFSNFLEIVITSASDYTLISSNNDLPEPQVITISQFLSDPESFEHEFIRINGVSITNGSWPTSGSANLDISDDGGISTLVMRIDSDTEIIGNPEPVSPFDVLGIASQYGTSYQILPRYYTDFMAGTVPPVIANVLLDPSVPLESVDVNVTASISDADGSIISSVLTYTIDQSSNEISMSLINGSDNLYSAIIPGQSTGTTVSFNITATDDGNNSTTSPGISYTVLPVGGDITPIYEIQYTADLSGDSPLNGQTVTVSGIVTAEFWGSNSNSYLYVQDSVGPWNGVLCYYEDGWDGLGFTSTAGLVNSVAEGDSISVTGVVSEVSGETRIIATEAIIHGASSNIITPNHLNVVDLWVDSRDAEAFEGCLVKVTDVIISDNTSLGGDDWLVSDNTEGVLPIGNIWDYYFFPEVGQSLSEITGIMSSSSNERKLMPRLARDVVEANGDPVRVQRIQQVLHSDLIQAGLDQESDFSYMDGDTVTLKGVVTMPTGLSYAGDGVKFIFSDINGGPWSAILCYDPDNSAFPVLFEGDLIQVTGYIGEYSTDGSNMTELFITSPINILDFDQPLPPVNLVKTGDLRWPTTAEKWGNVMVRVEDAIVTDNNFQWDVFEMDDGSGGILLDDDSYQVANYFASPENGGVGKPSVGYTITSATGWVYHHYGSYSDSTTYKLCPLYPDDIVFGEGPPIISDVNREPQVPDPTDSEVMVSCKIEDNSVVSSAEIRFSVNGGNYQTSTMTSSNDSIWTGLIPINDNEEINYYILAFDDGVDQDSVGVRSYPFNIQENQLGFVVTDDLKISHVQKTPWPSGTTRYQGCEVTLKGIVTADTAQYRSGYSSYVMQDGSGQWSGLVFDTPLGEEAILTRGDEVEVTGTIDDFDEDWSYKFDGNTRLINSTIVVLSSGNDLPSPALISCVDVDSNSEDGDPESYEGVLVRLDNITISVAADNLLDWKITDPSGGTTIIDDDMANMGADNFMSTLEQGDQLDYVIGVFNYSFGTHKVQIRDLADLGQTVSVDNNIGLNAHKYSLLENFPNPFNPKTKLRFELGGNEMVKLVIYDSMGRQIRTVVNGQTYDAGFHSINWDGRNNNGQPMPSGVYIYRIKAGNFIAHKKMLLVK